MENLAKKRYHLGCGTIIAQGFLNIDGDFPMIPQALESGKIYPVPDKLETYILRHDLRNGIPADDDSIDVLYHSHFFEHLTRDEGRKFLADCYRCLKPEVGVMRIVVPDFELWCQSYIRCDTEFFNWYKKTYLGEKDGRYKTKAQIFTGMLYNWGHMMAYDYETLEILLYEYKFTNVKRCAWGVSEAIADIHDVENDNPRKVESLLLECTKGKNSFLSRLLNRFGDSSNA